jgi:hypothetical protein
MVTMPKLLVFDKSVFHSLCCCEEKLCTFVKDYNVILPNALAIECLISEKQNSDKDPVKLVQRFDVAIKAGAKYGYSSYKIFQAEKKTLRPAKSIVDENTTQQFRNGNPNTEISFVEQEAEFCRKLFEPIIKSILKISRILYDNLCEQDDLSEKLRKNTNRTRRFQKWIQDTDQNMKKIVSRLLSKRIGSNADESWFTWQMTRLWFAYCIEWTFKKNLTGSSEKRDISNDLYDLEYVTYLSRADGLLTNDKKLQVPLAKAAFPKKEVFEVDTNLNASRTVQHVFTDIVNKVPQSYRI